MKLKTLASLIASLGLAAAAIGTAQAAVVLDGWQLETNSGTTTDIGRLNLVSGSSTIEQEVNGTGNVFVGARFVEDGTIFSISYTPENVVGTGDIGAPQALHTDIDIIFSDVTGVVTGLNAGGGFSYSFTSGDFVLTTADGETATGSIIGIGGNGNSTNVVGGVNGDSTILAQILDTSLKLIFRDNAGNLLNPGFASGQYLFEAVTNNLNANPLSQGTCSFDATAACASFNVASAGDAYITQVPEPATLGLIGLGLFGIGARLRRRIS